MQNNLLNFPTNYEAIEQQQIELADTLRFSLYEQYPALFEQLNYDEDRVFLEPSLFYHFSGRSVTPLPIEQIMMGYMPATGRPSAFLAVTDPFGRVQLPNLGYIETETKAAQVLLNMASISPSYTIDGHTLPSELVITEHIHPRIADCLPFTLFLSTGTPADVVEPVAKVLCVYRPALLRAFALLRQTSPEFWQLLTLTTREVALFESQILRSMASVAYQGTACINTEGQLHDEVFFVEDLAHQCGHVMFNLIIWQSDRFFALPKNTRLGDVIQSKHENRDLYGAFHGLFTYTTILHCLDACLSAQVFTAKQTTEALARLGFFALKFELDLANMSHPGLFTLKGRQFYDAFQASFEQIKARYAPVYQTFRYQKQSYIFNFSQFCSENPTLTYFS